MTIQPSKASQADLDSLREQHGELARLQAIALRNLKIATALAVLAVAIETVFLVLLVVRAV